MIAEVQALEHIVRRSWFLFLLERNQ